MFRSRKIQRSHTAFTIVELLVSIAIFALMTALVVAKYSNFNSSVLLTNTAYDVALAIRTAQTYGLSIKSDADNSFSTHYALYFNIANTNASGFFGPSKTEFVMYSQPISHIANGIDSTAQIVQRFSLKQGAKVSTLCDAGGTPCYSDAIIYFKRPDPNANITAYICTLSQVTHTCFEGPNSGNSTSVNQLSIKISSADDREVRLVKVNQNGQISVEN